MKSLLCTTSLAIGLAAMPAQAGDRPADYTGTIEDRGNTYTVLVHDGAARIDSPMRKGIASTYGVSENQRPYILVVRDSAGEITLFSVTGPYPKRPAPRDEWEDTGERRIVAGERCSVQQRVGTADANNRRCITADGVLLTFFFNYGQQTLATVKRSAVRANEVRAPVELFDLKRWGLSKAVLAKPANGTGRDYEAIFELEGGVVTVRRSGAWTSKIRTGPAPSTVLLNEEAGIMITTTDYGAPEIQYRRATKERELWPYPARPSSVNGAEVQTVGGETCRWRSRSFSVDASELECRTDDGTVLGLGFSGNEGVRSSLPRSFVRKPMALASIMPDPGYYKPERYGLH